MINYVKAVLTWLLYEVISSIGKADKATDKMNLKLMNDGVNKQAFASFNNRTSTMEYTYINGNPSMVGKVHLSFHDILKKQNAK